MPIYCIALIINLLVYSISSEHKENLLKAIAWASILPSGKLNSTAYYNFWSLSNTYPELLDTDYFLLALRDNCDYVAWRRVSKSQPKEWDTYVEPTHNPAKVMAQIRTIFNAASGCSRLIHTLCTHTRLEWCLFQHCFQVWLLDACILKLQVRNRKGVRTERA